MEPRLNTHDYQLLNVWPIYDTYLDLDTNSEPELPKPWRCLRRGAAFEWPGCLWIWPKHTQDFPFEFHCWHLRWCKLAGIVFKDVFLHNSLKNWSFNQTSFNCLQLRPYLFIHLIAVNTVDERHPAPVGMYKNPVNNEINYIYLPYQLVCQMSSINRIIASFQQNHLELTRPSSPPWPFEQLSLPPLPPVAPRLRGASDHIYVHTYIFTCISTKKNNPRSKSKHYRFDMDNQNMIYMISISFIRQIIMRCIMYT